MKEEIFQGTGKSVLQPNLKREQGQTDYNGILLVSFFFFHLFISRLDFHFIDAEYWQKAKLLIERSLKFRSKICRCC